MIIRSGATIYKIAMDAYGANTDLGMDLIKELNPQIEDLNWVFAGQDLLLPSLTRETLLRQQPDGSYHLIVASFRSLTGAEEHARLLRNKGYQVTITPRRVSDDLLLHRVKIDGLKTLKRRIKFGKPGYETNGSHSPATERGPSGKRADMDNTSTTRCAPIITPKNMKAIGKNPHCNASLQSYTEHSFTYAGLA